MIGALAPPNARPPPPLPPFPFTRSHTREGGRKREKEALFVPLLPPSCQLRGGGSRHSSFLLPPFVKLSLLRPLCRRRGEEEGSPSPTPSVQCSTVALGRSCARGRGRQKVLLAGLTGIGSGEGIFLPWMGGGPACLSQDACGSNRLVYVTVLLKRHEFFLWHTYVEDG